MTKPLSAREGLTGPPERGVGGRNKKPSGKAATVNEQVKTAQLTWITR